MDIDAYKARGSSSQRQGCFRCGSLEHIARNCPQRYDIRYMTQEEFDEVQNQRALDQDTADLEVQNADKKEDF